MSGAPDPILQARHELNEAVSLRSSLPLTHGMSANPARGIADAQVTDLSKKLADLTAEADARKAQEPRQGADLPQVRRYLPEVQGDPAAARTLASIGMPGPMLRAAMDQAHSARNEAARGRDATENAMRITRAVLGPDADKKIQAARLLVERDPQLKDVLTRTGLNNSPIMARHLAQLAQAKGLVR